MLNKNEIIDKLKSCCSALKQTHGITNMAIFGSFARGDFTAESDLDIFVELDPSFTTYDNFIDIKFYLEDLLNIKIDLITKNSLRPEMTKVILKEALYV